MCDKVSKPSLAIVLYKVSRVKVLRILFCLLLFATITKISDKKKHTYRPRDVTTPATLLARAISSITEKSKENFSSNIKKDGGKNTKKYKSRIMYCTTNFEDGRKFVSNEQSLPIIYFVTPTYPRPEQYPLLIRLSHTLMHVPRIFWIVADDNTYCSKDVETILKRSYLPYIHIASPKIKKKTTIPMKVNVNKSKKKLKKSSYVPGRGVANRRAALRWLQATLRKGILYFGDDDNTYDLELFNEIRKTKKLSMLPVGLIGHIGFSAPFLEKGKVAGFIDSWPAGRKFPVDMAGFAVNMKHLRGKHLMRVNSKAGMLEDIFLRSAGFQLNDIEPLANNCSKILAWHTRVKKAQAISPLWNRYKSALNVSEFNKRISNLNYSTNESMFRFVIWSSQAELYASFANRYKT